MSKVFYYICDTCGFSIRKTCKELILCPECRAQYLTLRKPKKFKKGKPYQSKHIEKDWPC